MFGALNVGIYIYIYVYLWIYIALRCIVFLLYTPYKPAILMCCYSCNNILQNPYEFVIVFSLAENQFSVLCTEPRKGQFLSDIYQKRSWNKIRTEIKTHDRV